MPELRKDPIVGRWVIIATERAKRPKDYGVIPEVSRGGVCPFCPGNEHQTPPEVLAYRPGSSERDKPGWTLRVIPNKFPALRIEGDLGKVGEGMFDKMNGIGAHEVIIESPNHADTLSSLSEKGMRDVLWAYRERILDLRKDRRLRYILIFKNHGLTAGASLEHTHSQLIALPVIPKRVLEELNGSFGYYQYKDRCVICDMIRQEIKDHIRLVAESQNFVSLAPYASRFPFETWIIPKFHICSYEETEGQRYDELASIFSSTLKKLDRVLNNPPYNFILHEAPLMDKDLPYYHWHFEIIPRLTGIAGFEWGSGFYINPTPPEHAAKFLRELSL